MFSHSLYIELAPIKEEVLSSILLCSFSLQEWKYLIRRRLYSLHFGRCEAYNVPLLGDHYDWISGFWLSLAGGWHSLWFPVARNSCGFSREVRVIRKLWSRKKPLLRSHWLSISKLLQGKSVLPSCINNKDYYQWLWLSNLGNMPIQAVDNNPPT